MRQIAIAGGGGHPFSAVETAYADPDAEVLLNQRGDSLEGEQAVSPRDSKLNHLNRVQAQPFCKIRRRVNAIGIVGAVKDSISDPRRHAAQRKPPPQGAGAWNLGQTGQQSVADHLGQLSPRLCATSMRPGSPATTTSCGNA